MAQAGYTGPSVAYEGHFGFYNVFLGANAAKAEPALVTAQLGERWEFPTASIKLYPACHHIHAFVNAAKVVPYMALGLMDLRILATSVLLLPLAPLGVWVGVWLVRRVSSTWFYRLAYVGMLLTGSKLLWDGLKG